MPLSSIPDVLEDLRAGKMIVLVDDEDRENEGDLILPAEKITPAAVNFMLREARGMLFVALDGESCERLKLNPKSAQNTAPRGPAYPVSVDASPKLGGSPGVSAFDRATTTRRLAEPMARAEDFDRPGH